MHCHSHYSDISLQLLNGNKLKIICQNMDILEFD